VQSPFRRRSVEPTSVAEVEDEVVSVAGTRSRAYTPSKRDLGQQTPKRKAGGRVVEAPPSNRREALKRLRAQQREQRAEARAGMMAGDERYLMARDKGPERRLVRDIVDARRNLATFFLPGALVVVLGSSGAMPRYIQLGANLFWVVLAVGVIGDSFMLTRRVKRTLTERFPKAAKPPRSYYWYAIMRSLNFRKLRMPAPRVNLGDPV
jgi:hypothetical protein